jgi:uncharacterized protein
MAQLKIWGALLLACLSVLPAQAASKKTNVNSLLVKRQYGAAIKQLEAMANKGDARAQFKLGSIYRVGLGVPADANRASLWLRKSAANGNATAVAVLKRMAIEVPPTAKKLSSAPSQVVSGEQTTAMTWLPQRQPDQQSWLTLAAARNLPKVIGTLIDVNDKFYNVQRDRALLTGTVSGSKDVVAALLEAGANPNTVDDRARTPVLIATAAGNATLLQQLLTATPDLSMADASGTTPLGYAALNCDSTTFKTLVDEGAKDGDSAKPALITVFKSCKNAPEFLPSIRGNLVGAKDRDGRSIVWYAAALEDSEVLNAALAAGGDASLADMQGYTPLHVAAMAGHRETIRLLLALGSTVDVQSKDGATPLMLAASAGRIENLKFLAEQTSDIDIKDSAGDTALLRAVRSQHKEAVQILLEKGANKRARSISGETPEKLAQRLNTSISTLFATP